MTLSCGSSFNFNNDDDGEDEGIIGYVAREYAESFAELYADVYTSMAVFRSLPMLPKTYVLRSLLFPSPHKFEESTLKDWLRNSSRSIKLHTNALHTLLKLHIVTRTDDNRHLIFDETFSKCLRNTLCVTTTQHSETSMHEIDADTPTLQQLEQIAYAGWHRTLHFIIGSRELGTPSSSVCELIRALKFVNASNKPTCEGLRFLFKNLHSQLWTVIVGYMSTLDSLKMQRSHVLSFLFRLGCLEVGKEYHFSSLNFTQKKVVADLADLGIVVTKKNRVFYPTSLAISLSSGSSGMHQINSNELTHNDSQKGFICIETNFKVYSYTSSKLQIALLRAFIIEEIRMPNLVVGRITKRSIRTALNIGLSAKDIITFLVQFAHPLTSSSSSSSSRTQPIPSNVVDQIKLWESERQRIRSQVATLFKGFKEDKEFNDLLSFARNRNYVLWSSIDKQMFVTKPEAVEAIREYRETNSKTK